MPRLGVVIASVREGRAGQPVAEWFADAARRHGGFTVDLVDLAALGLPLLAEPKHSRLQQYTQETTKAWSARAAALDAFVFVTPEYNHGSPPALVNALDHLYLEWNYKPAAFVSYGGISGGLRSVQMTKSILSGLKMVPLVESVTIPSITQHLRDGAFIATEGHEKAARIALDELLRWDTALRPLRNAAQAAPSAGIPLPFLRELYAHMEWADAEVWRVAASLPSASPDGVLRERLYHIHLVQRAFLHVWTDRPMPTEKSDDFGRLADLRAWAAPYYAEARQFLDAADPTTLAAPLALPWANRIAERFGKGAQTPTLGETMFQVVAHSTYHRGQVNTRLRKLGAEPPLVDYIAWIWFGRPAPG